FPLRCTVRPPPPALLQNPFGSDQRSYGCLVPHQVPRVLHVRLLSRATRLIDFDSRN
ncbi:hypothetical protein BGW80DRAFT_1321846, partial [Lactifluus volemus]